MYQSHVKLLQQLISDDYRVHMQLDNLPVAIQGGDRCVSSAAPLPCAMVVCARWTWYHGLSLRDSSCPKISCFGVHARAFVLIWLVYMNNLVACSKSDSGSDSAVVS